MENVNYEQLDLFTLENELDLVNKNSYQVFDEIAESNDSAIYAKLDWYSAVFTDSSINEVIAWVGLSHAFQDEFFKAQSERSSGYDDVFVFTYNSIQIDVSKFYLYGKDLNISAFDQKLPRIRLNISGKGLDYLRSTGFAVDELFRDSTYLLEGQHITRADFAFDFINYKPEIIDQLIEYAETNQTDSGRIVLKGQTSALRASVRKCDQKTVYFGAPTSDKLLRVYDKRLQNIDRQTGLYTGDNPYGSPDSWVRIELQTRNKTANKICLSESDMTAILHYIHDYYNFADLSTPAHRREVAKFWQDFMDWNALPSIIQNLHLVEETRPVEERIDNSFSYWARNFMLWVSRHGFEELFAKLNIYLRSMQDFDKSPSPDINRKRWRSFINLVNNCNIDLHSNSSGLMLNENNNLVFNINSRDLYDVQQMLDKDNFSSRL